MNKYRLFALLLTAMLTSSCMKYNASPYSVRIEQSTPIEISLSNAQIIERLELSYHHWFGTPYGFGHQQPQKAADCSGLVQKIFKNEFAVNLPRTTQQQINLGKTIKLKNAQPGDLVFFNLNNGYGHVGVYIDNNIIMQATSSKGVTKTNLNTNKWWSSRVYKVKRVIN